MNRIATLTLYSYAKINLGLRVLRKRPDGYHDIETLMQTVDLADTLTVSAQPSGTAVTCDDPAVPADHRNLAARAVRLLRDRHGIEAGVRIDIRKRIPVAAGLAGGSGNAAMTLIALNRLWDLRLPHAELAVLAARLGSDVPFCLTGGTAIARGRGELLEPVQVAWPCAFVLVTPPCAVSTTWAYQHVKIALTDSLSCVNLIVCALQQRDLKTFIAHMRNDLEQPVRQAFPVVGRVEEALMACGAAGAVMSGSGPTVIGIAQNYATAERIAEDVRQHDPDWRVRAALPVSQHDILAQRGF